MSILNSLRGITGEFEIGRLQLAISSVLAVSSPIAFEAYEIVFNHGHFDVAAWCVAYPAGLAALAASGILSIASKDKSVAVARQTQAMPPLDDKGGKA